MTEPLPLCVMQAFTVSPHMIQDPRAVQSACTLSAKPGK